ncbi:MAG: hypothetical protein IID31_04790 [Planctomycetes bacterium]|nr:hypothetical protein [Planctomycetota bacterium]
MSARVCYLSRTDRGDALAGVRLVGEHTEDSWRAPVNHGGEFEAVEHVRLGTHAAGEWVANALRAGRRRRSIDTVCVDVDGSSCTWVTSPSERRTMVAAAYAQAEEREGQATSAGLSTVEPMSSVPAGTGAERRVGLMAVPDSVTRLFLDELDRRGIAVRRVCSLWQLIAEVWDPSGPGADVAHTRLREDRIVAEEAPASAVVLVEPCGRLVWVWSASGKPIAGGSMRLRASAEGQCLLKPWDMARLGTEWLAWSAQTGCAPRRVLVIVPPLDTEGDPGGLSAAEVGEHLGRAWPNASIDLAVEADPVGETLARAVRVAEAGTVQDEGLVALTRRPGRTHRSMYRWWAAALLAGAGTLGAMATSLYRRAGTIESQLGMIEDRQREILRESASHQDLASEMEFPRRLETLRNEAKGRRASRVRVSDSDLPKPILAELLNVAFALEGGQYDEIEPKLIELGPLACRVEIWVPEGTLAYDFQESLVAACEVIEWSEPAASTGRRDVLLPYTISGVWKSPDSRP